MTEQAVAVRPAYEDAITGAKERFELMAGGNVNWSDEEIFAMQALTKNDYVFKVANENPRSVQLAMINVASTGLTLNPAMGYAYLVPRDGQIMLDISYKGLIKIATDTGSILWARAECVYENDRFTYHGPAQMPEVVADPFRDRGAIIGSYSIAKTVDGDILVEVMNREQIDAVRAKSQAWVRGDKGKKGPWEEFETEMIRKSNIKRAQKTWPHTDRNGRLATAVALANDAEGGYVFEAGRGDDNRITLEDERKQRHDEAVEQYGDAIAAIKLAIENESWERMTMHWNTIPSIAQVDLWLAPTKGGVFTTRERNLIRNPPRPALADESKEK